MSDLATNMQSQRLPYELRGARYRNYHPVADGVSWTAVLLNDGKCNLRKRLLQHGNQLEDLIQDYIHSTYKPALLVVEDRDSKTTRIIPSFATDTNLFFVQQSTRPVAISGSLRGLVGPARYPDWNFGYLLAYALLQRTSATETAFHGIRRVPQGHFLTLYNCGDVAVDPLVLKVPAGGNLERSLQGVLRGLAQANSNIVLSLSGGLDSTTIGAVISSSGIRSTRAVNFYLPGDRLSDERVSASQVAQHLGLPLSFIDMTKVLPGSGILESVEPFNHLSSYLLFQAHARRLREELGDDALLLDGQGGDQVFVAGPEPWLIFDALRKGGWASALRLAQHLANSSDVSRWTTMLSAMRQASERLSGISAAKRFLRHQRQIGIYDVSAAKRNLSQRVTSEVSLKDMLPMFYGAVSDPQDKTFLPKASPYLFAGPLAIAGMIPPYEQVDGSGGRLSLRKIIAGHGVLSGIDFRLKANMNGIVMRGMAQNHKEIAELIRNGVLAREGFVRMDRVEYALRCIENGAFDACIALGFLVCTEYFARSWMG